MEFHAVHHEPLRAEQLIKKDRQCNYYVILKSVVAVIVVVGKQQVLYIVCVSSLSYPERNERGTYFQL